jgi:undecaprenyl-diphosphatase
MTSSPQDAPRPWRSRFARLHPTAYLGVHGVAGMVVTIGLVWLFLAIADEIPEHGTLPRADTAAARWLEAHGTEGGERIFFWVSYLGAPVLAASVAAAVLYFVWRRDWRRAIALAVTSAGGLAVSTVLKLTFHRGRPETATEFITRQSWSFPSGHAMSSMICYGFLTMLLLEEVREPRWRRRAIVAGAAILIGAIGFSRVYLGVHYLSDVVGGWLAGAAWLFVCVSGYRFVQTRQRARAA